MKTRDYEKFEAYMRQRDSRIDEERHLSIGMKDDVGRLLVLGGRNASIWRTPDGLYRVDQDILIGPELAVTRYNQLNSTKLPTSHITEYFNPWYAKQWRIVTEVPSRTKVGVTYSVSMGPGGQLACDTSRCLGYRFRGTCWHIEAVRDLLQYGDKISPAS